MCGRQPPVDRLLARSLSAPGFGVPLPDGFEPSPATYRDWLAFQLELFKAPVDLVGHDWGGIHVAGLAMSRPDLVRSWASDALGVFAPDYQWHARAQVWQQEGGEGEASVKEIWGGDLQQRIAVAHALGITGRMAERVAASMDPEMGDAVLKLLRAARQPTMAQAGQSLSDAAQRPGLALIAVEDVDRASGTVEQHEWAGREAGATLVHLDGVGHWWPEESPAPVAKVLTSFWAGLPPRSYRREVDCRSVMRARSPPQRG
jgi:pimeloyl-ACP methyl ester carboxylesterase